MARKNRADGTPDLGSASTDVVEEAVESASEDSTVEPTMADLPAEAAEAPPTVGDPPADAMRKQAAKAKQPGHTICKVTGTAVMYLGKFVEENTIGEFSDEIVLAHPSIFISLED